jgi:hypothetical protein
MLTKEKIIATLRGKQAYLAAEFGVSRIGVFGSFANGQPDEESDVDVLVEFDRPIGFRFFELADYLESLLGRKVDLLTPTGIQNIRRERVAQRILQGMVYV